jgi:hypothetical protein
LHVDLVCDTAKFSLAAWWCERLCECVSQFYVSPPKDFVVLNVLIFKLIWHLCVDEVGAVLSLFGLMMDLFY